MYCYLIVTNAFQLQAEQGSFPIGSYGTEESLEGYPFKGMCDLKYIYIFNLFCYCNVIVFLLQSICRFYFENSFNVCQCGCPTFG